MTHAYIGASRYRVRADSDSGASLVFIGRQMFKEWQTKTNGAAEIMKLLFLSTYRQLTIDTRAANTVRL